jgi:hypothetical protein
MLWIDKVNEDQTSFDAQSKNITGTGMKNILPA